MALPRQLKSWELRKLEQKAVKDGLDSMTEDNQDLLDEIRDLSAKLTNTEEKLRKERDRNKKLKKQVKALQ